VAIKAALGLQKCAEIMEIPLNGAFGLQLRFIRI
jgi:hypothetical protein